MVPQILPAQLKEMLDAGTPVLLVDVRENEEHAYCALPNSVHIPLGELITRAEEVEAGEALVVVYCHHGVRSISGAAFLLRAGLPNVASLAGGIDMWSQTIDAGVPRY